MRKLAVQAFKLTQYEYLFLFLLKYNSIITAATYYYSTIFAHNPQARPDPDNQYPTFWPSNKKLYLFVYMSVLHREMGTTLRAFFEEILRHRETSWHTSNGDWDRHPWRSCTHGSPWEFSGPPEFVPSQPKSERARPAGQAKLRRKERGCEEVQRSRWWGAE